MMTYTFLPSEFLKHSRVSSELYENFGVKVKKKKNNFTFSSSSTATSCSSVASFSSMSLLISFLESLKCHKKKDENDVTNVYQATATPSFCSGYITSGTS